MVASLSQCRVCDGALGMDAGILRGDRLASHPPPSQRLAGQLGWCPAFEYQRKLSIPGDSWLDVALGLAAVNTPLVECLPAQTRHNFAVERIRPAQQLSDLSPSSSLSGFFRCRRLPPVSGRGSRLALVNC